MTPATTIKIFIGIILFLLVFVAVVIAMLYKSNALTFDDPKQVDSDNIQWDCNEIKSKKR